MSIGAQIGVSKQYAEVSIARFTLQGNQHSIFCSHIMFASRLEIFNLMFFFENNRENLRLLISMKLRHHSPSCRSTEET